MINRMTNTLRRFGWELRRAPKQSPGMPADMEPRFRDLLAGYALQTVLQHCDFDTVLDIGSGSGIHADYFQSKGKRVSTIDMGLSVYYQKKSSNRLDIIADYLAYQFQEPFDLVWASHVLEHQPNPHAFLVKIHKDLRDSGWLALTVPPLKQEIVGGHVTLWNAGLMLYQLILAGFDCSQASILRYGYNVTVLLRKQSIASLPILHYDSGDIDRLSAFFPAGLSEGFDGDIPCLNWPGIADESR
jgi:SAM-dependent methyltransferase